MCSAPPRRRDRRHAVTGEQTKPSPTAGATTDAAADTEVTLSRPPHNSDRATVTVERAAAAATVARLVRCLGGVGNTSNSSQAGSSGS